MPGSWSLTYEHGPCIRYARCYKNRSMIAQLYAGALVCMPSRDTVRLVRREGVEWVCAYEALLSNARGEVLFTGAFLRTHCTLSTLSKKS